MNKIIILGHENPDVDSIVSGYLLEKILNIKGYNTEFIIPDDKIDDDTLDICSRYDLDPTRFMKKLDLNDKSIKYILVDHNERDLSGEIVCIIDHHFTNKEIKIKHYYNKKISSTACYICYGNEELLDKYDLKLAIIATLVDTASFHSDKSRKEDEDWVKSLCVKYNLDYNELQKDCLCLTPLDNIEKVSLNGLKKYNFEGKIIESSYIQINKTLDNKKKIFQIIDILKERIKRENIFSFVFIIHDMTEFKTEYYFITEKNLENIHYDFYASRGDTIIPEIEQKLKS